jgi:hypothetical protein
MPLAGEHGSRISIIMLGSCANTLATRLPPSPGEARVGGFSITTQPAEITRAIGDQKK